MSDRRPVRTRTSGRLALWWWAIAATGPRHLRYVLRIGSTRLWCRRAVALPSRRRPSHFPPRWRRRSSRRRTAPRYRLPRPCRRRLPSLRSLGRRDGAAGRRLDADGRTGFVVTATPTVDRGNADREDCHRRRNAGQCPVDTSTGLQRRHGCHWSSGGTCNSAGVELGERGGQRGVSWRCPQQARSRRAPNAPERTTRPLPSPRDRRTPRRARLRSSSSSR